MAGQLDSAFKQIAKQVVADLGSSFDSSIVYTRKASGSYNTATGAYILGGAGSFQMRVVRG